MNRVAAISGLVGLVLLSPRLAAGQSVSYQNIYVLNAKARQSTTTTATVTLRFSQPLDLSRLL